MPVDAAADTPSFDDVLEAARRIAGHARRTPLLADTPLDALTGNRILLKLETLQHTGSFKFRGAYNRLAQLDAAERRAGVVAFSSGNHAQGVAAAAKLLGIAATIVMPSDAPRVKMQNTLALGASVVEYDRQRESREEIAARLATERGAVLVPSFDDPARHRGPGHRGPRDRRAVSRNGRAARRRGRLLQRRRPRRRHRARHQGSPALRPRLVGGASRIRRSPSLAGRRRAAAQRPGWQLHLRRIARADARRDHVPHQQSRCSRAA